MIENSRCKITTLLLLFFVNSALIAQIKKHKTASQGVAARQTQLTKHKKDTSYKHARQLFDVKSKEIVTEFQCNAGATVILQNVMRRINIRTSTDNKVKLVTKVYYQGSPAFTDEQWLNKLELAISGTVNNVVVTSGNFQKQGKKINNVPMNDNARRGDTIFNSISIFDSLGNWVNRKSSAKDNFILYVPAGVKLEIESKYADVILENNMGEVKVRITNGGFTMIDADKLIATSVYGSIYAGSIKDASVDMTNGRLTAKKISTLTINSKNSTIDLDKTSHLKMTSYGDRFEIEEAHTISGQKNYGDLRLTMLTGLLDINGVNADMRIRTISPSVSLIKMTNQYADLRLPVTTLKNYTVAFEGTGGNVYTPFEKNSVTDGSFKAIIGNANDKPTVLQLKCNNCSVDFK